MTTANITQTAPQGIGAALQRLWRDPAVRIPVMIWFAARVLTLVIALTAARIGSPIFNPYASDSIFVESLQTRHLTGPLDSLIDPWHRWDSGWYMKIAGLGYASNDGSIIFAPLYPVLMAIAGAPVHDTLFGGLVVSTFACLAVLMLLYQLVDYETRRRGAATSALLILITFPTAFYLLAAYTESLYLALVLGTFLSARYKRWWLAGILAGFASLTRIQGWVLFFPLGWMAFVEAPRFWQAAGITWAARLKEAIPRLFAMGMAPFMSLCFILYTQLSGLGSISEAYASPTWALQIRPPWDVVIGVFGRLFNGTINATEVGGLIALCIIVIFSLASLRVLSMPYHIYTALTLIFILLRYVPQNFLNGTMRYALDFFPVFITLGVLLVNRPACGSCG